MRKKITQFVILASVLGILFFGVFVQPQLFVLPPKASSADYLFEDMHLIEFVRGAKTVQMRAHMASLHAGQSLQMQTLDAAFWGANGPVSLLAPEAMYDLSTGYILLVSPNVSLQISGVSWRLAARSALWRSREGILSATGNVHVGKKNLDLFADRLLLVQKTGQLSLSGRARATWEF